MFSCSSYSSPGSSGSSLTVQFKLTKIWEKIQCSNPLLACLVDVKPVSDIPTDIIRQIKLEGEHIMEQLGTVIDLRLIQMGKQFYIQLFAIDAQIWAEIRSTKDNKETVGITTDTKKDHDIITETEEATPIDGSIQDSDDSVALDRSVFKEIEWPSMIYSSVKIAFENFSSTPRYSKEACRVHSPSSVIESTLSFTRGEVLCVKVYRKRVHGVFLTSFYHFGVYVGKMTTKDGEELEDAVIHLTKTKTNGSIDIGAVLLEGNDKDTCFVMKRTKSGSVPLLFKVIYGKRTQTEMDNIADRALNFYNNSDHYLKEYSLFSNNCEHFANMCVLGKPYCEQHVRAVLTTLPSFFKAVPATSQVLRYILIATAQIVDSINSLSTVMSYIGEFLALIMLIIEYVFGTIWDIYLLKKSGRLTCENVRYIMKRRALGMAPEALAAVGFVLVALLCTFSGPVGVIIGLSGTVIMILLRYIARPRIERWIEQREAVRLEDFLRWYPREVARLSMNTLKEDDEHEEIVNNFESRKLCGEAIRELVNQERKNPVGNHLANVLEFLDSNQLKQFKQNLKGIFGHFDISEQLKSSINLQYNEQTIAIEIPDMSIFTVRQLLEVARLNWQTDFKKGHWQVNTVNPDDNLEKVIASHIVPSSTVKEIETIPDSPTIVKLVYKNPSGCTLS